jgi:hypothetical protein
MLLDRPLERPRAVGGRAQGQAPFSRHPPTHRCDLALLTRDRR